MINRDRSKEKKKRHSTCQHRRINKAGSTGVVKASHLWTNLALPFVAGWNSFEKPYKHHLIQNQAMQITADRTMQHRAILGDFASPDSQIVMETSIIGCRIAQWGLFTKMAQVGVCGALLHTGACWMYGWLRAAQKNSPSERYFLLLLLRYG